MARFKLISNDRALDDLLSEAQTATQSFPSGIAEFTYYGVNVLFDTGSNARVVKSYVLAALRDMVMPVITPGEKPPLSNSMSEALSADMLEDETQRRLRLNALQRKLDREMDAHLTEYDTVLCRNHPHVPFMLADWVAGALALLASPLLSQQMRLSFFHVMEKYGHEARDYGRVNLRPTGVEPHVKARLEACKQIKQVMTAIAYNIVPHDGRAFQAIVNSCRDAQDALELQAA
jgi:hypothetical protein